MRRLASASAFSRLLSLSTSCLSYSSRVGTSTASLSTSGFFFSASSDLVYCDLPVSRSASSLTTALSACVLLAMSTAWIVSSSTPCDCLSRSLWSFLDWILFLLPSFLFAVFLAEYDFEALDYSFLGVISDEDDSLDSDCWEATFFSTWVAVWLVEPASVKLWSWEFILPSSSSASTSFLVYSSASIFAFYSLILACLSLSSVFCIFCFFNSASFESAFSCFYSFSFLILSFYFCSSSLVSFISRFLSASSLCC